MEVIFWKEKFNSVAFSESFDYPGIMGIESCVGNLKKKSKSPLNTLSWRKWLQSTCV
jgi:hypothetical protein